MNKYLIGSTFSGEQSLLVLCIVLFNLLMIGNEMDSSHEPMEWMLFWQLVFALSMLSSVSSNILTEAYFKAQPTAAAPGGELRAEYCKVVTLNLLSSAYRTVAIPPLVYIVFPVERRIAVQDLFSSNLWSGHSWAFYLATFAAMGSNITATILFRYTNVTYTAVMANVAGLLQVVLVSLSVVGPALQQTFSVTQYMIYGSLTLLSLVYTYHQRSMPKHSQLHHASRLIAYFREGRDSTRINALIAAYFVLVLAATVPLAMFVRQ